MSYKKEYDVETAPAEKPGFTNETDSADYIGDEGAVSAETFVMGNSLYARAQRLAGKFGVEQRGIERVPSDERLPTGMSQIGTLVSSGEQCICKIETDQFAVALCQHGRLCLRHWSTCLPCLLSWIHRHHLDHTLRQPPRYSSRLLLLDFWPTIWTSSNGSLSFLLWMVWCENQ
jgi:hypothetical protein